MHLDDRSGKFSSSGVVSALEEQKQFTISGRIACCELPATAVGER